LLARIELWFDWGQGKKRAMMDGMRTRRERRRAVNKHGEGRK
jgi:hypothetical protein